jgi:hypothetical protein
MAAVATTTDFVVSEDVIEHVKIGVHKHLRQRQRRRVAATSLTLVDRIMLEFEDIAENFWERVGAWYALAMERTEPRCRGFVTADFFEIVAAHVRNDEYWREAAAERAVPADIEERARRDAYMACTCGILDYTADDDVTVTRSANPPNHRQW